MNHPKHPSLMSITARPEQVMVRGAGSYLWDDTGQRYLDFIQGWAVNALGHCPPEVAGTLAEQSRELVSPSPALHNAPQLALSARLVRESGLAQAHFANSGAEANEAAVKLARKWGQRHRGGAHQIITTQGGFHGRTLAMMSASGKAGWDTLFAPMPGGFVKVPFGEIAAVRNAITDATVAIMVEPVQGEAGVIVPPPHYLAQLRQLADEHDLLLILDEVQTGMGRTGHLFACQGAGIKPDILTLGKGLGGGVPISALVAAQHACCFAHGDQGGTYNGNPLMCAVALAVLESVSEPAFLAHVRNMGNYLRAELGKLGGRHGFRVVRGAGLLLAVRLADSSAEDVRDRAFERGLLINAPRPDTLRLMPSLRVSAGEIDDALALLDDCLLA